MRKSARRSMPRVKLLVGLVAAACVLGSGATSLWAAGGPRYTDWSAPVNLGPAINTAETEQGGATSKNGLSLYFFRRPQTNLALGGDDIWVSQRASVDDEWGAPVKLGPTINTAFEETNPSFSRDEHWMFFASTRPGGLGGATLGDIWASWRPNVHDDFGWQTPINLGTNVNTTSNDYGVSYFENAGGNPQLYFASDRPGGAGLGDLYVTELQADGSWGPATRIPELNTAQSEGGTNIRHDGLEIFFVRSPPGVADLWVATRDSVDAPWSTPVNVGPPVNTAGNDFDPHLFADGQTLLFNSNKPGGFGQYDLYMTTRSKVDRAPVANADSASTTSGGSTTVPVLANDTDPDGDALTPSIVTSPARGTAAVNPDGTIAYTAASSFAGTDTFTYRVSDGTLSSDPATVTIAVQDATPPTLAQAADVTGIEATSAAGATVSYATPTATDNVDPNPAVVCTPASGSVFPLGTTTVNCTATDAAGNVGHGSFHVGVVDTTAPVLTLPSTIVVNATRPPGATVTFTAPAIDTVDPNPSVVCTPASGSAFPIGSSTVNCTATDAAGNGSEGSFLVRVRGAGDQLKDLEQEVIGVGPGRSLVTTVEVARLLFAFHQIHATCLTLTVFNLEVRAQSGKKIPRAQAADLIADANQIKDVLGC